MTNVLPRQRAPGILRETARTGPSVRRRRKATPSLPATTGFAGRHLAAAADRKASANVAVRGEGVDCGASSPAGLHSARLGELGRCRNRRRAAEKRALAGSSLPSSDGAAKFRNLPLEGKRIGQQPDSKSGAQKWVGGSNPLPSASKSSQLADPGKARVCGLFVFTRAAVVPVLSRFVIPVDALTWVPRSERVA